MSSWLIYFQEANVQCLLKLLNITIIDHIIKAQSSPFPPQPQLCALDVSSKLVVQAHRAGCPAHQAPLYDYPCVMSSSIVIIIIIIIIRFIIRLKTCLRNSCPTSVCSSILPEENIFDYSQFSCIVDGGC